MQSNLVYRQYNYFTRIYIVICLSNVKSCLLCKTLHLYPVSFPSLAVVVPRLQLPTGNEVSAGRHWPHGMECVNSIPFSCFGVMGDSPSTASNQSEDGGLLENESLHTRRFQRRRLFASGWLKFHHWGIW